MSAPNVLSSQSATVPRKLPIITLTPTITLTATVSAAAATDVRLNERETERGAIRPRTPNSAVVIGVNKRMAMIEDSARKDLKNTICPVMPEEAIVPDVFVIYKGQIVSLCCDSCPDEFKADPAKFMKILAEKSPPKAPGKDASGH